jgi:hypothetical protein
MPILFSLFLADFWPSLSGQGQVGAQLCPHKDCELRHPYLTASTAAPFFNPEEDEVQDTGFAAKHFFLEEWKNNKFCHSCKPVNVLLPLPILTSNSSLLCSVFCSQTWVDVFLFSYMHGCELSHVLSVCIGNPHQFVLGFMKLPNSAHIRIKMVYI